MTNSTTFLTIPAGQRLGTQEGYFEKEIDFSKENLAAGNSIDVLNVPKGAIPTSLIIVTKTANTDATAQIAVDVNSAGLSLQAAAVLPAVNAASVTNLSSSNALTADDTVRVTGSIAALTDAVIVVGLKYIVSDALR